MYDILSLRRTDVRGSQNSGRQDCLCEAAGELLTSGFQMAVIFRQGGQIGAAIFY